MWLRRMVVTSAVRTLEPITFYCIKFGNTKCLNYVWFTFFSEIKELFRIFDTNNDRSISLQELGKAMRYLGMSPTQQQIQDAMKTLDKNGNYFIVSSYFVIIRYKLLSVVDTCQAQSN